MAADGTLRFDTKIDSDGFNRGTSSITQSIGKLKGSLTKLGAAVGIAFGVRQLIAFGKTAIETASDLQEVQNVVDVAFGDMAYKMEEFADSAIEMYGISKLAAKQTGSTLMAMASGMGIATDAASDMAIQLTALSADMASFYNKEQQETFTALKSVFTGETETLKAYGIVMTEANLQQFAYTQGIHKKISAMTQAEKVQLRYNYVMQQTALAQGDFARTSDSWANQTRILSMQWQEFAGVIGTALINIALPAVRALNTAMSHLITLANKAVSALAGLFGWDISTNNAASAASAQAEAIAVAADNQNGLTEATENTAKAAKKTLAGFDKINKLNDENSGSSSAGGSSGGVSVGSTDITMGLKTDTSESEEKISSFSKFVKETVDELKKWWETNFTPIFSHTWDGLVEEAEELKTTFQNVFEDIQSITEPLKEWFRGDFTEYLKADFILIGTILVGLFDTFNKVFSDLWNIVIFPMIQLFVTTVLPFATKVYTQIVMTLTTLFNEVKKIFDKLWQEIIVPVLTVIMQIWTDFVTSVKEAWDKWGKPIFDNIRTAIEKTSDTIQNYWNKYLKPIWDALVAAVKEIWTEHLKPLLDNFLDFVGEVVNGALEIYNKFILPVVNWFVNKFGPPISNLFTKMVTMIKTAVSRIIDVVNGIVTALKGIVQFIVGVFTGDWEKAWTGIKNFFGGIWDSLVTIVTAPIEDIQTLVGKLKDWIGDRWEDIKDFFSEIPDWFEEKFQSAWTKITEVFSLKTIKEHFEDICDAVQEAFKGIPDWFDRKFSDAWQKVKDVFSKGGEVFVGIKDGIVSALKSVINGLIGGINKVISVPFSGINTALQKVRDISIANVQPFKNKISLINVPQIPYLATGTVVPANYGEFLSVLGDNKKEPEIVSPLSTMKQALAEALREYGNGGDIHLVVQLDGDVVYKSVVKRNKQNTKRTGVNALGY